MAGTALITGASSGIGRELARVHAEAGGGLILTARNEAALQTLAVELKATHGVVVHVFARDLGDPGAAEALFEAVTAAGLQVDILINNAGFGGRGAHADRPLDEELAMIDLNVRALVALTHFVARDMAARGAGRILNVGSTAGFMPGPNQAVYFATKAFVNSFSQALDQELRGRGVTSTLLAPGYVETGFAARAGLKGTKLVARKGATAESVARHGYAAMLRGDLVTVNEAGLGLAVNWLVPLLPRRFLMGQIAKIQGK